MNIDIRSYWNSCNLVFSSFFQQIFWQFIQLVRLVKFSLINFICIQKISIQTNNQSGVLDICLTGVDSINHRHSGLHPGTAIHYVS